MIKNLKLRSLYSIKNHAIGMAVITTLLIASICLYLLPVQTKAATTIPLCEITRSLTIGSSGEDVRCLQRYLNWAGFTVSPSGVGSPGNESLYFGQLTASAVTRWQNSNSAQVLNPVGLTSGTGYFGPSSFNWYVSIVTTQLALP